MRRASPPSPASSFLLVLLPIFGARWSESAILWGALSGVAGAVALSLLYACLAIGPMSILSPLTAVVSAIVPLTWGVLHGERFAAIGWFGLGLALVAVVLVGFVPERGAVRPRPRGLVMAVALGRLDRRLHHPDRPDARRLRPRAAGAEPRW